MKRALSRKDSGADMAKLLARDGGPWGADDHDDDAPSSSEVPLPPPRRWPVIACAILVTALGVGVDLKRAGYFKRATAPVAASSGGGEAATPPFPAAPVPEASVPEAAAEDEVLSYSYFLGLSDDEAARRDDATGGSAAGGIVAAPNSDPTCVDSRDECAAWAAESKCVMAPDLMARECKNTCNSCGCVDANDKCAAWASKGLCAENPTYMARWCKKSCKSCDNPACVDEHDSCENWALHGECEKNPNMMNVGCKRSCGQCYASGNVAAGAGATTAPAAPGNVGVEMLGD